MLPWLAIGCLAAAGLFSAALVLGDLWQLLGGSGAASSPALLAAALVAILVGTAAWAAAGHQRDAAPRRLRRRIGLGSVAVSLALAVALLASHALPLAGTAGIGPTEGTLLAVCGFGALLGATVAAVPLPLPARHHLALALLTVVLLAFACVVARFIAIGSVMGFDESIYALTTRSWIEGTPATGWASHRSPGISVLGIAPLILSGSDAAFRVVGLLFGLLTLLIASRFARDLAIGWSAAIFAALGIGSVPSLQLDSAAFLTDVPSSALVLLFMWLIWRRFESARGTALPVRSLLPLAPLAAAAFYVRYGASLPILFASASAIVVWPGTAIRSWRAAAAALALLLVLLLPHFVFATMRLGSPLAIALEAQQLARPDYPAQAVGIYLGGWFSSVAGPVAGTLGLLGVLGLAWRALVHRRWDSTARGLAFLVIPAIGLGALLGVVALAQTRYIYVPICLLVIAGSVVMVRLVARAPDGVSFGLRPALVLVGLVALLATGTAAARRQAVYAPRQRDVVEAALAIRADALRRTAGGAPDCAVLTYLVPEVTWYSGCATYHFAYPPVAGRESQLKARNRYLLLVAADTPRQPHGAMLAGYLALVDPQPLAVIRDAVSGLVAERIYRFR